MSKSYLQKEITGANRTYVSLDDELLLQILPTIILKSFCCPQSCCCFHKCYVIFFPPISYLFISRLFVLLLDLEA